jgi:hypothetical protein
MTAERFEQLDYDRQGRPVLFVSEDGKYRITRELDGQYTVLGPSGLVGVRPNLKRAVRLAHEDRGD